MTNWIAQQSPLDVDAALRAAENHPSWAEYLRYANQDRTFALWLRLVDRRVQRATGGVVTLFDLGDFPSRDSFDEGLSPKDAIEVLRDYDDMFDSFMSEQYA